MKRIVAEAQGTFVPVLGGCGSAVLSAAFPGLGIGFMGVALAFGLSVLIMAYAVGHISGGHFNPAVTLGLLAGGRFPASQVIPYIIAQLAGGIAAGAVLYLIASGFAANGYGEHSPGGFNLLSGMITEGVLTAIFLIVIMGVTRERAAKGAALIAIGLALALIHLISIPVTNTSVNPARSTAVALFQGDWALSQLWMFWLMPVIGAVIGGAIYRGLAAKAA
ncbi:aquaporin Z [Pantoea sp. Eser]|nr:aquaporin Z [Pantoea sp. Eser]